MVGIITSWPCLPVRSSTFVVGYMLWLICRTGACYQMDALHNLVFGAIISATDPVRCG